MKRPPRSSNGSDGLTEVELRALHQGIGFLQSGWTFESEHTGPRGPWGMISQRGRNGRAYLVCREDSRILLLNADPSAPGELLGGFDNLHALLQYLAPLLQRS